MPTENRSIDPRDLFISANPNGLSDEDLVKEITGFADPCTHADYLVFLAGYEAGKPVEQATAKPALTLQMPGPHDDRDGPWFDTAEVLDLRKLPAGTKLFLHPPTASARKIERLRADLEATRSEKDAFGQNAIDPQVRLAKQDALSCEQDSAPDETWSLTDEGEGFTYDSLGDLISENKGDNRVFDEVDLALGDTIHRSEKHYPDPQTSSTERMRLEIEDHMGDNARANGFAEVCDGYPKAS